MPRRFLAARPRLAVIGGLVILGVGLAACTPDAEPTLAPTAVQTTEAAPSEEPAPAGPMFQPDGTAADNLPFFAEVVAQVWASPDNVSGRAYIDALVAAGFAKADMQVTSDLSTVGRAAESIQFSVRWGDAECLIGQVGPSTGEPVVLVMDQLAEGRCLVGSTRAIDW